MFAVLENRKPCHKCGFVAFDSLHKTTPTPGEVIHKFGLAKPQAIKLDQIHVSAQARRYSAAVPKAKKFGGLAGLPPDHKFKWKFWSATAVAHPMQ
jgi:hypothetical protein